MAPAAADMAAKAVSRIGLSAKANDLASSLTLPDLKMLELARALAASPRVLLLDEVMAGLRPVERERISSIVRELHVSGMTVLLIEHVMRVVMALAGRVIVLHHGDCQARNLPGGQRVGGQFVEVLLGGKGNGDEEKDESYAAHLHIVGNFKFQISNFK